MGTCALKEAAHQPVPQTPAWAANVWGVRAGSPQSPSSGPAWMPLIIHYWLHLAQPSCLAWLLQHILTIPTALQPLASLLTQNLGTWPCPQPGRPCFPLILNQLLSRPTPFPCFHIALLYYCLNVKGAYVFLSCLSAGCLPPREREEPLVRTEVQSRPVLLAGAALGT